MVDVVDPRDRLIVALDLSSVREAESVIERLDEAVNFYKIGYQLALAGGLPLAAALVHARKRVFLDLKLHDIANTVARGVENVAGLGVHFLTIHAYAPTMRAAVEGSAGSGLKLLAVTVLTSYDDADLEQCGYASGVQATVRARAQQAQAIGVHGLVCSPREAAELRALMGSGMLLVTPGIRPRGSGAADHKRVLGPADAIRAGADYLVIGRPILEASNPRAAAEAIISEMRGVEGIGGC
jgi:orotidine-5'-phosphate decarboxylase